MVEGLSTKAIARRLGVAYKTVENHKIRVFEKLRVRTHAQAVSVAIEHQLVLIGPNEPRTASPCKALVCSRNRWCGLHRSHVVEGLLDEGFRVRVLDDLSSVGIDNVPSSADL